jgi:hypothetical protein
MNRKEHREAIYAARQPTELSGFQSQPALSLDLIERAAPSRSARIRDVGRGASTLVDGLLSAGYRNLTVMDLSPSALDHARRRLGAASSLVTWMEGGHPER